MKAPHFLALAGLAVACLVGVSADEAQAAKKKKKANGNVVAGVISRVEKNGGTTILHVRSGSKKANAAAGRDHRIVVDASTKVERLSGKKKGRTAAAASASQLHRGERVIVHVQGGKATKVDILAKGKKKKKT